MMGHVVLLIFIVVILMRKDVKADVSDCPDNYLHYQAENTCIERVGQEESFEDAKKSCEKNGEHLVFIQDDTKPSKLSAALLANKDYWVGMADLDKDGTFTYMNGSVVESEGLGVGRIKEKFSKDSPLRCVVYSKSSNRLMYKDCEMKYEYICEKNLDVLPDFRDPDACTMEKCFCYQDDWFKYVERGKTQYMILNQVYEDIDTSIKICTKLGGELLTIQSHLKHDFLLKYSHRWNPKGLMYWLAMRFVDGTWKYIKNYGAMFQRYKSGHINGAECIGVVLQHKGGWRMIKCDSNRLQQICETFNEPCTPEYFFATKNGTKIESATMVFERSSPEILYCKVTGGYLHGVLGVNITCVDPYTKKKTMEAVSGMEAALEFTVGIVHADNNCSCVITMREKIHIQRSFQMDVLTVPVLSKKSNIAKYEGKFGESLVLDLQFYSNPPPEVFDLSKPRNITLPDSWKIEVIPPGPGEVSIRYIVRVVIAEFKKSDEGKYRLFVSREPNENFTYTFMLTEKKEESFNSSFLLALLILALLGIAGLMTFIFRRRKEDEEGVQDVAAEEQLEEVDQVVNSVSDGPDNAEEALDEAQEGSERPSSEVDGE